MRRHTLLAILGAFLVLASGCGPPYGSVEFDRIEATQYSRSDLHDLVWGRPPSELAAALTSVNRRDHPFLDGALLAELRGALEKRDEERAGALVEAIGWCGWRIVGRVRATAAEFADRDRRHRLAAIGLLRLMGESASADVLIGLMKAGDPEVARAAREAVTDLFGAGEASTEPVLLPGSTPWVLRRLVAVRTFVLTGSERKARFELRKSLSLCPLSRRVDMYRQVIRSCTLPLEEFPGRVEMGLIGRRSYPRERMGHAGEDFVFYLGRHDPKCLRELSSDLLADSAPEERSTFWRLLAHPLATRGAVDRDLYDAWIERDLAEAEAFYFLAACSRRQIQTRSPRELAIAATVDWSSRFEQLEWGANLDDEYIFHKCVEYLAGVTQSDGPEFHRPHRWGKGPCVVDPTALREVLSREYVWDPGSQGFVPKE